MVMKRPSSTDEQIVVALMPEQPKPALVKSRTNTSGVLSIIPTVVIEPCYDIEHIPVQNNPRAWSSNRKTFSLILLSFASMISTLSSNTQNPDVERMQADLRATSAQFSLSSSTFILVQGLTPLIWSAISEVKGHKFVCVTSLALFTLANIMLALSQHMEAVIGFRGLQAAGSSAVMAVGAASLGDIFDSEERGRKMGIYNAAPILGPALGPAIGGIITSLWCWRAIFWFLALASGTMFLVFGFFFRDTFRHERSSAYQNAHKRRLRSMAPRYGQKQKETITGDEPSNKSIITVDVEKNSVEEAGSHRNGYLSSSIKLSIININPLKSLLLVVRRKNNFFIFLGSGLLFAYGYLVSYATARTLSRTYDYGPLKIGFVTLSYGAGCMLGSVLGGYRSDRELVRLQAASGSQNYPEMRLKSTVICACISPFSAILLAWLCWKLEHVSLIPVSLFFGGFLNIWIYSITLTYIVDANPGRSSTAVAVNSACRGVLAFVAVECVVPLQDCLGNGWLYTIWSGAVAFAGVCILIVWLKGAQWREQAESQEKEHERGSAVSSSMESCSDTGG